MRWSLACMFGLALAVTAAGCRSCDRVESELRVRERELRELKEELERTRAYNNGLQAELHAQSGAPLPVYGEPPVTLYPIRSLVLGRQTGGREDHYGSGDQLLQVVVEPHDAEDQAVKVPGSLIVQALEFTAEGGKRPLSTWEVPAEELRRSWHSGLLSTGYTVVLPWKRCPTTEKLRIVAQFKLPDGRVFEADKDVTIHVPLQAQQPLPPPEAVPVAQPEEKSLPLPRRVDPPGSGPSISNKPSAELRPVRADQVGPAGSQPAWRVVLPRPHAPVE
jgi:hypothetical protein